MKKLLVLGLLTATAFGVYAFVLRPPAKRACIRAVELCGLDPGGREAEACVSMLDSLEKSNPASIERVRDCMSDAKSCGEAAGCASGVALTLGAGFVQDFVSGMQKSAK